MMASGPAARRFRAWLALGLLLLAGLFISSCSTESDGGTEIDWTLSDTLKNYSNVVITLVDKDDTSKVLAMVHEGKLEDPGSLASFKLPDSIGTEFRIVIRGYDENGLLAMESKIAVDGGKPSTPVKTPWSELPAYKVVPQPPSNLLAVLDVSEGSLSPAFDSTVFEYTAEVSYGTLQISIHASARQDSAVMTLEGNPLKSGEASNPLDLLVGDNVFNLVVKPTLGSDRTYKITVKRKAGNIAQLASLGLSTAFLTPAFDPDTLNYAVTVPAEVETVLVSPVAADPLARIAADGKALDSLTGAKLVALVPNVPVTVQIAVTSQDSSQTLTYSLKLTRSLSSDAALSSLQVTGTNLSPDFNPDDTVYSATTAEGQIAILPTARDKGAKITVNNAAVNSGSLSGLITTPTPGDGVLKVAIKVTAADGKAVLVYTVNIKRSNPSSIVTLELLHKAGGTNLDPAFSQTKLAYKATASRASDQISVRVRVPRPAFGLDTPFKATINGADMQVAVTSTDPSFVTVELRGALKLGLNVINLQYQDGPVYQIRVTREYSKVADLSAMLVSSGILKPAFSAAVLSYTDTVTNAADSIKVTATPADTLAKMIVRLKRWAPIVLRKESAAADTPVFVLPYTVIATDTLLPGKASKGLPLAVGHNLMEVQVIAEDTSVKKVYSVSVERRPSSNAFLAGLTAHAGKPAISLSPAFAARTFSYSGSTTSGFITVTPTGAEPGQAITVNGKAVATGTASQSITLAAGPNTVKVEVLAPDKVGKATYTLSISKTGIIVPPKGIEP